MTISPWHACEDCGNDTTYKDVCMSCWEQRRTKQVQEERWESQYAEFLEAQMEAQYYAELEQRYKHPCGICPATYDFCRCPTNTTNNVTSNSDENQTMDLARQVLDCPMVHPNDADAETVGEFLSTLLIALWDEGECFSGKRPLGNSDWQWQVLGSLVKGGLVKGTIDSDGGYEQLEYSSFSEGAETAANKLIISAIRLSYNHCG